MNYYLEEAQLAMEKAIQVSEFYEDMEELNIREAECRALSAGGGFQTLCDYFEDATGDSEKKDSIIKRAWEAILNFCRKIKELFTGKKENKADPSAKVQTDSVMKESRGKIISFFKKYGTALSHPIENPKAFIKAVTPLVAMVAAVKLIKKKKSSKVAATVGELQKESKDLKQYVLHPIASASEALARKNTAKLSKEDLALINKAKSAFGYTLTDMNRQQSTLLKEMGESLKVSEQIVDADKWVDDISAKTTPQAIGENKKRLDREAETLGKDKAILKLRMERIEKDIEELNNKHIINTDEDEKKIHKLESELRDIGKSIKDINDKFVGNVFNPKRYAKPTDFSNTKEVLRDEYEAETRKLLALKKKMDKTMKNRKKP